MEEKRPVFPKRAVVTGGMPYGNKPLHFGHIGGYFVHADTFARFLRDRIGPENVIFISGMDCYGSPITENYRKLVESGEFEGSIEDFVKRNYAMQKETLDKYYIDLNLYAASALPPAAPVHEEMSEEFFMKLYEKGFLTKMTTSQFYDTDFNVFLNGRQVVGQCPIQGCTSEKGYADECDLGHQYQPSDLINPKSALSGKKPEMRDVTNWYFKINEFNELLNEYADKLETDPEVRPSLVKTIREFLKKPVIYVKREYQELLDGIKSQIPGFNLLDDEKSSVTLEFDDFEKRDEACLVLAKNGIRFRTGKA
ncbi:MAG: class I tRNA ligase family protein, partial [Clostridiales bacterium]|nr:class I tRNA ligase family protein [Clostridiales bacterium]